MGADFRLAVVDPGGSPDYHRMDTADPSAEAELGYHHSPVELCAFAACTGGAFHGCRTRRDVVTAGSCQGVPEGTPAVLLLVDKMRRCRRLIDQYHRAGKTVVITFTEAGTMQIAQMLRNPARIRGFHEVCRRADGAIAVTPEGVPVLRDAGARHVELIPTPCPIDVPSWDFSVPVDDRTGILIGTTYFHANERNHFAALAASRQLAADFDEQVTVVIDMTDPYDRRMRAVLESWWPDRSLRVVEGPLPFFRYLRLMATHRLVFQLDQAAGCGQVGALALLCRIPCVGGYGGHEREIFPHLCGFGRSTADLMRLATRLLTDRAEADAAVAHAVSLAMKRISFGVARNRLAEYYARVGRQP
jgi:hypothetical protein